MVTVFYSILHMLVDGICAIAMFGWFASGSEGYLNILLYNFCAFAMQMPFGAFLDVIEVRWGWEGDHLGKKMRNLPFIYASAGVILTLIGAFVSPVILGIGNALFHVGGGVAVINEDERHGRKGQELGIFVAPGALGLYLGSLIAEKGNMVCVMTVLFTGLCMVVLIVRLYRSRKDCRVLRREETLSRTVNGKVLLFGCFLIVILRSFVGMTVSFPWKTTVFMGLLNVLAVVAGKMSGGVFAARFGIRKVVTYSLLSAAVFYLLGGYAVFGIGAQFFFNMTMPITLYLLVRRFKRQHGFSFGVLTFGLFLGFLPVYLHMPVPIAGSMIGSIGGLLSLIVLLIIVRG